jgi:hypothetical protein
MFTKDEYFASPALALPFQAETIDFTLTELEGECAECGKPVADLRGRVNEYAGSGCIDIRFGGICRTCRLLTPFHFRWYPEQKRVLHKDGHKWVAYQTTESWFYRLIKVATGLARRAGLIVK